jgi:hypothetical protein
VSHCPSMVIKMFGTQSTLLLPYDMHSGDEFFSKLLKGCGLGNANIETEQKKQLETWLNRMIAKKEETQISSFVMFLETQNVPSKPEVSLDHTSLAGTASVIWHLR